LIKKATGCSPPVLPVIALPVPDLPVIDQSMTGSDHLSTEPCRRFKPPPSALDQSATGLEPVGQKPTQE